ncbi:MAG: hypothetical protein ACREE2_12520 [Stellaceae bacterium]
MRPRLLTRSRKRGIGAALALLGISLWLGALLLHVTPLAERDVSFPNFEARMLGIVAGGVSVTGGIVLIAAA